MVRAPQQRRAGRIEHASSKARVPQDRREEDGPQDRREEDGPQDRHEEDGPQDLSARLRLTIDRRREREPLQVRGGRAIGSGPNQIDEARAYRGVRFLLGVAALGVD